MRRIFPRSNSSILGYPKLAVSDEELFANHFVNFEKAMREEYDFSQSKRNPYAAKLKSEENDMDGQKAIQLFEDKRIRTAWDEEAGEWYFSIVDVVAVLTDQPSQRGASNYWAKLKERLVAEGFQLLTNCQQLSLKATDGKRYKTDVANTEGLLRIIQSIPSPKAEPFKRWLAQIGKPVITEKNAVDFSRLIGSIIDSADTEDDEKQSEK